MKKKKFSDTQIVTILEQYEGGRDPIDLVQEYGISKASLFKWRKKYAARDATHVREIKALQDENRGLKQMYAELMLDYQLAKSLIEKRI